MDIDRNDRYFFYVVLINIYLFLIMRHHVNSKEMQVRFKMNRFKELYPSTNI